MLQLAIKNAKNDELRSRAAFILFESYLDLRQWQKADAIFDQANQQLTPAESLDWLGRVAIIAASQGNADDAMRIWRRVVNSSLRNKRLANDLSKRGLKNRIDAYYADVRRRLPGAKL